MIIGLELLGFSLLAREMDQLAHGPGPSLQAMANAADSVKTLPKSNRVSPTPQNFRWNWREWQELDARQSLRNARITNHDEQPIAAAIVTQLRPMMNDLKIQSEDQLLKAALDTRIKMIDLNRDGIPEVVAQGMHDCGATGNCPFWVFQKEKRSYKLLAKSYGQTFTIQRTATHGFRDIVVSMHGSATQSQLTDLRYEDGSYHDFGCYDADWEVLEGDTVRKLKEPRITPCDDH